MEIFYFGISPESACRANGRERRGRYDLTMDKSGDFRTLEPLGPTSASIVPGKPLKKVDKLEIRSQKAADESDHRCLGVGDLLAPSLSIGGVLLSLFILRLTVGLRQGTWLLYTSMFRRWTRVVLFLAR